MKKGHLGIYKIAKKWPLLKNLFLDYSNGKNVFELSMELFKVVDQGKKAKNFGFLSKNEVDFLVQ